MVKVNFHDSIGDRLLKFAVIISRNEGRWVLCKHKERNTYEFPGGHREAGEDILSAAKRELYEETGAIEYSIKQIGVYSVCDYDEAAEDEKETFGMLYFADILKFDALPGYEIERIELFDNLPDNWTYPEIQPKLLERLSKDLSSQLDAE